MTSPFDKHRNSAQGGGGLGGGDGPMKPGDTKTITGIDPKTGEVKRPPFTLIRTDRPYVYDLCDAYNASRTQDLIDRGGKWFVTHAGELKLGEDPEWTTCHTTDLARKAEDARNRWKRSQPPEDAA